VGGGSETAESDDPLQELFPSHLQGDFGFGWSVAHGILAIHGLSCSLYTYPEVIHFNGGRTSAAHQPHGQSVPSESQILTE
jgi:hypothetical protein